LGEFWFDEHTADVKFHVKGDNLENVFEYAALALFEAMVDTSKVEPNEERIVEVEGKGRELTEVLYDFLTELIVIFEVEGLVFSRFDVKFEDDRLKARCWGEKIDIEKHDFRCEVKAVTFHELMIEKNNGYSATVVLDT